MTWVVAAGFAATATPSWAANRFIENLHKAQARREPGERLEYYDRAVKTWEPADGMPLLGQAHFGRGQARVETWQFSAAEPDLTKALDLDPANAKCYLLRGQVRIKLAKYNEAAQDLAEYIGRNPSDVDGLLSLSQAQLKAGRKDAALSACRLAQQTAPAEARAWLCEARVWMARKVWASAASALDAADEKARHRLPEALTERAVCRVAQGRHEQALSDYSAALALYDERLQDLPRRAAAQPEIAEQRQTSARTYYGRGRVLEFMVRPADAVLDYQQACRLGHAPACERAEALAPKAVEARPHPKSPPAVPSLKPEQAPRSPKRRKTPAPASDPGPRIYGS